MIAEDALAHREVSSLRGYNAVKLCGLRQNVGEHSAFLLPDPAGFLAPSTCLDVYRYVLHTNDLAKGVLRKVAEATADCRLISATHTFVIISLSISTLTLASSMYFLLA